MSNYHRYLTNLGYLIKKDEIDKTTSTKIKKDLTFKPFVCEALRALSKPTSFFTFKESPGYFFVPRFYGLREFGEPVKNLLQKGSEMRDICRIVEPFNVRPHQIDAYEKTRQQLLNTGGGILSVFCGWGKTFMAIYLAVKLHGKTLVLVHKEDLFDQWKAEIMHFTGGTASIGCIQQSKIDVDGHDFVLAMIPSLSKREYPPEVFKQFQLLIVDECHHVGSEVFSRALDKTAFKYTLGLSATPFRKDKLTEVFTNYLGPIFHIEKRSHRADTLVLRLPLTSDSSYYEDQYFVNGTRNTAKMVLQIVDFPQRNELIIRILASLYQNTTTPERRKTLILSKSRRHLTLIYDALKQAKLKWGDHLITVGYYWGRSPSGENGLTRTCVAPIPEIVKTRQGLSFDVKKTQPCIFNCLEGSSYCIFHQYIGESISSLTKGDPQLCGVAGCYNYFWPDRNSDTTSGTVKNEIVSVRTENSSGLIHAGLEQQGTLRERLDCPICRGTYQLGESLSLSEALKEAKTRRSSKVKHKEMLENTKECDIILGTNDIASEALNIPGLNTLIQATPQQEVEQTVGRILRKQSIDNKNPPLIIDLIDHCGNFVNHSRVRLKTYKNEGFRLVNLAKLDMDNRPFEVFNWNQFNNKIKDHSFGMVECQSESRESDNDLDNDRSNIVKCLL